MKKVIRLTEGDLVRIVKKVLEEQGSDKDTLTYFKLRDKIMSKYPDMCTGDKPKVGKNLPFDPEVKELQVLHNKGNQKNKMIVDGIIGPQMKKYFCQSRYM